MKPVHSHLGEALTDVPTISERQIGHTGVRIGGVKFNATNPHTERMIRNGKVMPKSPDLDGKRAFLKEFVLGGVGHLTSLADCRSRNRTESWVARDARRHSVGGNTHQVPSPLHQAC